jgi:hypothetical protein
VSLHHPPGLGQRARAQTNAAGQVVLKLKTTWRDGTTHLDMSRLEFMQRLVALYDRTLQWLLHGCQSRQSGARFGSFVPVERPLSARDPLKLESPQSYSVTEPKKKGLHCRPFRSD